jgi:hypothetical protein
LFFLFIFILHIKNRKSKNRQHNGQKKKYKRTNNDLNNIHKTKDRVAQTALKSGVNLDALEV